mmetsp:Transcript_10706/g.14438  ORF Transcript_10706/g.14438 Transcript_10706/m.14438 type:complete len:91 (-) Transcript_10706:64-336(-)
MRTNEHFNASENTENEPTLVATEYEQRQAREKNNNPTRKLEHVHDAHPQRPQRKYLMIGERDLTHETPVPCGRYTPAAVIRWSHGKNRAL